MAKKNSDDTETKRFEVVPIETLHHDPANARKHGKRNLDSIKASIQRWGQQDPLIVGKGDIVLAGNGRLDAMREMGLKEVTILRTDLAGSDAIAFAIAHNRTGELASWDDDTLANLLSGLAEDGINLDAVGFTEHELERLVSGWAEADLSDTEDYDPDKHEAYTVKVVGVEHADRGKVLDAVKKALTDIGGKYDAEIF